MNSALKIAERNQMGTFHSISIPNNVIYMYNVKIHAVHVNTAFIYFDQEKKGKITILLFMDQLVKKNIRV